jgi:hypothetical protein
MLISSEGAGGGLHTQGGDFLPVTHFLNRGDPNQKGDVIQPGFLQVVTRSPEGEGRWRQTPPAGWRTTYHRRSLAEWITDVDHGAGHLLARVIVNRLWQHHLGRGIVNAERLGFQGEPAAPELLDFLASTGARQLAAEANPQTHHDGGLPAEQSPIRRRPRRTIACSDDGAQRLEAEVIRDACYGRHLMRLFGPVHSTEHEAAIDLLLRETASWCEHDRDGPDGLRALIAGRRRRQAQRCW